MSEVFHLKILASDKTFFEGQVISMTIPAYDGSYQIMAHHEPVVMALKEGVIRLKYEEEDGNEVTSVNETTGNKYRLVSELPIFDSSVKSVDLYTGEASWYKIGDDLSGGTLSVDKPENSNIYVYNKYSEMVYSTHMHVGGDIPLPAGGYIVFLGETGDEITF